MNQIEIKGATFDDDDRYFEASDNDLEIYDNRSGKLQVIGTLKKGEIYPRVNDYSNWHQIQFGDYYGFVSKEETKPSDGNILKNENISYPTTGRTLVALVDTEVYDNTSGELVSFATIKKGTKTTIVSDYSKWWRVIISGRVGYLLKNNVMVEFDSHDLYFEVTEDNQKIYDNRSGKLEVIGTLEKGEIYPRVNDYSNWHQIQFGDYYGFVSKEGTRPSDGNGLKNEIFASQDSNRAFSAKKDISIYKNSTGELIPFMHIKEGVKVNIAGEKDSMWKVIISNRIGYLSKDELNTNFSVKDRYFKVVEDNLEVFDNRDGKLKRIAVLKKGEVYPRVKDYTNWHKIQFGNYHGFVSKVGTIPSEGIELKNENNHYPINGRVFTAKRNAVIYDNTTGSLVPYMVIQKGAQATIISDYSNWWRVVVGSRIGYIRKEHVDVPFNKRDRYFMPIVDNLEVYDNRSGKLELIATLNKGEVYPRVKDHTNWHQIQFGNYSGYVPKQGTVLADNRQLNNENKSYEKNGRELIVQRETKVYDNTSGKLIPFTSLVNNTKVVILADYTNWWKVVISNRVGYVSKTDVMVPIISSDQYFTTIQEDTRVFDSELNASNVIATLPRGKIYKIDRVMLNGFIQVNLGGKKGYIKSVDVSPALKHNETFVNDHLNIGTLTIKEDNIPLYDNNNGYLEKVVNTRKGITLEVRKDYGNWLEVNALGRYGYVSKNDITYNIMKAVDLVQPKSIYSYEQMVKDIHELETNYSKIISTKVIGESVNNRDIYAVKLGNGEKKIMLNGSHHAREWMTTNVLMEMIDYYAATYVKNGSVNGLKMKDVLDDVSIWFVPMVNPDGVTLAQVGINAANSKLISYNYGSTNFQRWKSNINGVDLNRQYPYLWNSILYNKLTPSYENHKGSYPLSEPEVKSIYNFTNQMNFSATIAYHSSGEVIYSRYRHNPTIREAVELIGRVTGYLPIDLSSSVSGGGYTDWFIGTKNRIGMTIEIAPLQNERPVPLYYWDSVWNKNKSVGIQLANFVNNL
ncbi:M14 family zinc carboxypeptidase [Halolactibacillus sp. JCM 19043]|uniref:M14 family zinc carboxypeptidase n=1 Tax=Halolactibacillus sp. JCM 19043 TaxID=1460638 RepID=UPI0018D0A19E|nr:M14 family zinc carboxypeptidase [Halolactibacillus sp. JCM 19043]